MQRIKADLCIADVRQNAGGAEHGMQESRGHGFEVKDIEKAGALRGGVLCQRGLNGQGECKGKGGGANVGKGHVAALPSEMDAIRLVYIGFGQA